MKEIMIKTENGIIKVIEKNDKCNVITSWQNDKIKSIKCFHAPDDYEFSNIDIDYYKRYHASILRNHTDGNYIG